MRIANKLLLSFVAFFVLLMLLSDYVLWSNFLLNKTGDGDLPHSRSAHVETKLDNNIKVLIISGRHSMQLSNGDPAILIFTGDSARKQFNWEQKHDTLYMTLLDDGGMLVSPDVREVILSEGKLTMSSLDASDFKVTMGDSSTISIWESQFGKLNITAGTKTDLELGGDNSVVDSLTLRIGKESAFRSYNVPYQRTDIKMDSLKQLELTGRSLISLKGLN